MMKPTENWEEVMMKMVRYEKERGFEFLLLQLSEFNYATLHQYRGSGWYIQEIGMIDEDIVLNLTKREFIDDHAIIHITPKKYTKIWRNKEFR